MTLSSITTDTVVFDASNSSLQDQAPAYNLTGPSGSVYEVSLHDLDCFTQEKIGNLLRERLEGGYPYFLAAALDEEKGKIVADGIAFLRNFYKFGRVVNPLTQKKITHFRVYEFTEAGGEFTFLCDEKTLRMNHDFFAKYINSFDPALSAGVRGNERFAVGLKFEDMAVEAKETADVLPLLSRAHQMYQLGAGDLSYRCHLKLADWYHSGNELISPSLSKKKEHMLFALAVILNTPNYQTSPRFQKIAHYLHQELISS